jgi:NTP pyrophosphatase (non-canonical NTP hydrolase)
MMNLLDEYQNAIRRTAAPLERDELLKLALIGLADELGEVIGPVKKYLYHQHELDLLHLEEEIGDLCWYLGTLCNALDLSLFDALTTNIAKLKRRYPDGFSQERSLHRHLYEGGTENG